MASKSLTRQQKAMQLVMQSAGSWVPVEGGVRMPSQNRKGVYYTVSLDSCDCNYFQHHDGAICKHIQACRILCARVK